MQEKSQYGFRPINKGYSTMQNFKGNKNPRSLPWPVNLRKKVKGNHPKKLSIFESMSLVNAIKDQTGFISTLKLDLIQIQEEIDNLDFDCAIRNQKPCSFSKFVSCF